MPRVRLPLNKWCSFRGSSTAHLCKDLKDLILHERAVEDEGSIVGCKTSGCCKLFFIIPSCDSRAFESRDVEPPSETGI